MTEPRLAPMIAGLVCLSAGAGLSGLLLVYGILVVLFRSGSLTILNRFFLINVIEFVVSGSCVAAWIKTRQRVRRLSKMQQRLLIFCCAALSVCDVVILALYIR